MPNEVSGLPVYSSKSDPWESYGHVHETGSLSIPCSQCQWVCLRAGGNRIPFTPNPGFCQQPFFQNPLGKPSKSPGTAKKAWRDSGSTGTRRNIIVRCQFIPKGLQLGLIKGDLLLALSVFNNALLDLEYAGSVSFPSFVGKELRTFSIHNLSNHKIYISRSPMESPGTL